MSKQIVWSAPFLAPASLCTRLQAIEAGESHLFIGILVLLALRLGGGPLVACQTATILGFSKPNKVFFTGGGLLRHRQKEVGRKMRNVQPKYVPHGQWTGWSLYETNTVMEIESTCPSFPALMPLVWDHLSFKCKYLHLIEMFRCVNTVLFL